MERKKRLLCVFLAVLIFAVSPATVYGEESGSGSDDTTLAPYFFIEGNDAAADADSFPLKETNVTANISGVIADIYVVQTYANEGEKPINASYVFPASTRATVHGMKMQIGNTMVTAKIKEREEAKQEFEQAKSEGKSASLLEQQRPNVFTMSVANIMPGDVVRIELHYTELIVSTERIYQFVFPTVVGPRYSSQPAADAPDTDKWVATPYLKDGKTPPGKYNISVNLSAGVPITDLTCKSHKVNVVRYGQSSAQVTLSNPEEFAGNRDFILDYKLIGEEVSSGLMLYEGEDENFFMLMVQPPERLKTEDIPPREYIFVLDVSGSMEGFPLETAKGLIRSLITNLRETDKFNLVLFAGASSQMSPESLPATQKNIKSAVELIDRQTGGGGTELESALERAVGIPMDKNVSRSVIVITDGYISGEKAIFDIIHKNIGKANFFSFGIGDGVNRYLVDGIAKAGLGESFVVTESSEASAVADRFRTYVQSPVLTDINVTYNGFDAYDIEPPTLPDLFAQRPIVVFGKWRGNPSGTIQISGKTGKGNYTQSIQVSETKPLDTNMAVSYLWARTKVERLMDYGISQDAEASVKKEVTEIGLKYSMMTQYTSFIAVIEEIRNPDKDSTDVDQPLPLPLHVSNLAVGGYAIGSEPENIILVSVMLLTLLTSLLWSMIRKKAVRN